MRTMSKKLHKAYLRESMLWEQELVDYLARCQAQASGEESLSEIAKSFG